MAGGNAGVGRLTGESFNPGATGAGSYAYIYDARGRQTKRTITLGGVAYPLATQYNDAGLMTRFTYSDNEVLAVAYTNSGWLSAFGSTPAGKGQTLLASGYTFSGAAGFAGVATGATIAGGYYTYAATYDNDLRLTTATYKLKSSGAVYDSGSRGYDGVGNVVATTTTLTSGTDNQAFCYDEQNRLTWASAATGSPPCGGNLTGGTLTSAQYTASYAYDTLGRLTAAPLGSYTYGDAAHLDAATSVGTTYSASYDAAGDMTCRAPTASVTCSGTPTGNLLTYDNERRLATWQNTPSNPTSTASYWYDGEGNRVAQTLNGVTTYYVGNDEEITGSTLLKYYHIPGLPVPGTIVGVTRTYLASDGLGSETVDLSYNGSVLAQSLYGPYGVGRYTTGTMPTSKGYTGQRQDSGSGLDYYGARYYDGAISQFTSADTLPDVNPIVFGGEPQVAQQLLKGAGAQAANRYAYVTGNPETATDPTGRRLDPLSSEDSPTYADLGPAPDGLLVGNPDMLFWPGANKKTYAIGFRYSGKSLDDLISNLQEQLHDLKDGSGSDAEAGKEIALTVLFTALGLPFDGIGGLIGLGMGASVSHQLSKLYNARVDALSNEIAALKQVQANDGQAIFVDVVVNGHTELQTLPGGLSGGALPQFLTDKLFLPDGGGNPFKMAPGLFFTDTASATEAFTQVCMSAAASDFMPSSAC